MIGLYILTASVLVIVISPVFVKKEFVVRRSTVINKSPAEVFGYIRYLHNHKSFSKWTTKGSVVDVMDERDGTVGYVQPWNNFKEKAGIGELEIKDLKDNERLVLVHRYFKPVRGIAESEITIESEADGSSKIRWQYAGYSRYPLNLLTALLNMDKIVGTDLERCLRLLGDQLSESRMTRIK